MLALQHRSTIHLIHQGSKVMPEEGRGSQGRVVCLPFGRLKKSNADCIYKVHVHLKLGNAVSSIILILIVVRMDEILKSEPELER